MRASVPDSTVRDCLHDRNMAMAEGGHSWSRRCCLDLLVKMLILLVNSFGLRRITSPIVYVDEINNSSMSHNLKRTSSVVSGKDAQFLSFYSIERDVKHVRTGIGWTLFVLAELVMRSVPAMVLFMGKDQMVNERMLRLLEKFMLRYMSRVNGSKLFVLMTDHHFFSSIIAVVEDSESVVLQHGLIQDRRFFDPVRASAFLAWSEKSAALIEKGIAIPCGTYKFDVVDAYGSSHVRTLADAKSVVLILSSSKTREQIEERLRPLEDLGRRYGFSLAVKLHPGSFFPMNELINAASNRRIDLYKEEPIESIPFDFAIIEQSTAALDVACMGVPFIVIDDGGDSYFSEYRSLLPVAANYKELIDLAVNYHVDSYLSSYRYFLQREIASGICDIRERIDAFLAKDGDFSTGGYFLQMAGEGELD